MNADDKKVIDALKPIIDRLEKLKVLLGANVDDDDALWLLVDDTISVFASFFEVGDYDSMYYTYYAAHVKLRRENPQSHAELLAAKIGPIVDDYYALTDSLNAE